MESPGNDEEDSSPFNTDSKIAFSVASGKSMPTIRVQKIFS
jgi:hypothetical protein